MRRGPDKRWQTSSTATSYDYIFYRQTAIDRLIMTQLLKTLLTTKIALHQRRSTLNPGQI